MEVPHPPGCCTFAGAHERGTGGSESPVYIDIEMDEINEDLSSTPVVLAMGADDMVDPAAEDPTAQLQECPSNEDGFGTIGHSSEKLRRSGPGASEVRQCPGRRQSETLNGVCLRKEGRRRLGEY